jgi:hypothetical protein
MTMLKMKWITDRDGRLVATWIQSGESDSTGGRKDAVMLKMQWAMDHEGRPLPTSAQPGEPESSKDPPGSKVPRLVSRSLLAIMRTLSTGKSRRWPSWKSIRHATQRFFYHKGLEVEISK